MTRLLMRDDDTEDTMNIFMKNNINEYVCTITLTSTYTYILKYDGELPSLLTHV